MTDTKNKYEHIFTIEDEKGKRTVYLNRDLYTIGRSRQNNILIYGNLVSRYHAVLLRKLEPTSQNYIFYIIDGDGKGNKSTNGISINGKYRSSHQLKNGDLIAFGYASVYSNNPRIKYYKVSNETAKLLLSTGENVEQSSSSKKMFEHEFSKQTMIS